MERGIGIMKPIFMSHSSKDKDFVRRVANDLRANAFVVWLDEWEIRAGQCIMTEIQKGIENAGCTILALSESAVSSGWVDREWKSAYWRQINEHNITLVPILLEECKIPALIQSVKYVDFRDEYRRPFESLLQALHFHLKTEGSSELRLVSDALEWRNSKRGRAFLELMDLDGLEPYRDPESPSGPPPDQAADALSAAIQKEQAFLSSDLPDDLNAAVEKEAQEMTDELHISPDEAQKCVTTTKVAERILESTTPDFERAVASLSDYAALTDYDWVKTAERVINHGVDLMRALLSVPEKYDFVGVEHDDVRAWIIQILYLAGGNQFYSFQLPIHIDTAALQEHIAGHTLNAFNLAKCSLYAILLEEDYEKQAGIIKNFLFRVTWNEDEVEQDIYLDLLKDALFKCHVPAPRGEIARLLREAEKQQGLDEDVKEKLVMMREMLGEGETD